VKLIHAVFSRRLVSAPLFALLLTALFTAPALAAPRAGHAPRQADSQGHTWYVSVSAATSDQRMDIMDFLPGSITIDAGDTIVWTVRSGEIHTVTFLAEGQSYPGFNPNGDPLQLFPQGGSRYDGVSYFNSGILTTLPEASGFGFALPKYKLTFPITGDFTYYCLVHPGMVGEVIVQPKGAPYPHTQAWYDRQNAIERDTFFAQGQQLASQAEHATNNHLVYVGVGNMDVDYMRFIHQTVTIHVGQSVSFSNQSLGPHTVTFGDDQANIFGPYGDPTHFDGSYPLNSGILFGPAPFTVTFVKPGIYNYHCALHDYLGMLGTVIVTD
jgi:plastocyanin